MMASSVRRRGLLFCHANGLCRDVWDPIISAVTERHAAEAVLAIDMPSGCDRLLQKVDDLYPGFRNLEASGWNPAWNTEWCPGPGPYNSRELGIPTAAAKDPAAFDRRNASPSVRASRCARRRRTRQGRRRPC